MISQDQIQNLVRATAYDRSGDKIGKIGQVYYDDESGRPRWVTVNTGLFGSSESFAPLDGATAGSGEITLAFEKAQIKDAPNITDDGHLSPDEEAELYRYYGLDRGTFGGDRTSEYTHDLEGGTQGHDVSGPTTDQAMTRSEERLNVGTETQEAGRARLRKHVVTEQQQVSVPVSREEVTVSREPITEANRGPAMDGPTISEEEHELTLHEERPVVETEAVPVERVRLGTETVTERETVGGEVRKEQIEVDADDVRRR